MGELEGDVLLVEADAYHTRLLHQEVAGEERRDARGQAEGHLLPALDVIVRIAYEDASVGGHGHELLLEEVEEDPRHDRAALVVASGEDRRLNGAQECGGG